MPARVWSILPSHSPRHRSAPSDRSLPNDEPNIPERIAELNRRCADLDRDLIPVTAYAVAAHPARVEQLREAGAHRCVFNVRAGDERRSVEELARLVT